jgi:hypothetical protein
MTGRKRAEGWRGCRPRAASPRSRAPRGQPSPRATAMASNPPPTSPASRARALCAPRAYGDCRVLNRYSWLRPAPQELALLDAQLTSVPLSTLAVAILLVAETEVKAGGTQGPIHAVQALSPVLSQGQLANLAAPVECLYALFRGAPLQE